MWLPKFIDRLPAGLRVRRMLETIWAEMTFPQSCPPGHFYSPIPAREELVAETPRIFTDNVVRLPEIDLHEADQLSLLARLGARAGSISLPTKPLPAFRYFSDNDFFGYADGIGLATLLLELGARRYVEIGSGFSSALALDVARDNPGLELTCTFIEPEPERLYRLIEPADRARCTIIRSKVQVVPDAVFSELRANDILFVDGSHVAKVGSDLNDVVFRILPLLPSGVVIHFHDVYWPFEYRRDDVLRGRSWNEAYFLRAFLANNRSYRVLFFSSYLAKVHRRDWIRSFPAASPASASSLWIVKQQA